MHDSREVPQPSADALKEDDRESLRAAPATAAAAYSPGASSAQVGREPADASAYSTATTTNGPNNPFAGIFNFFKSGNSDVSRQPPAPSAKQNKIYRRSQTLTLDKSALTTESAASSGSRMTSSSELDGSEEAAAAAGPRGVGPATTSQQPPPPPRTSFFESAADLINPKLPSVEYIIDPSNRPRTIFHDRVYHPSDIPPPPLKKRPTGTLSLRRKSQTLLSRKTSGGSTGDGGPARSRGSSPAPESAAARDGDDVASVTNVQEKEPGDVVDLSSMSIEEKIARA